MVDSQRAEVRRWQIPFFTLWTAQAFSLFGSGLVHFALIWWLTRTTGSATVLATATLVGMLPGIVLGPLAGACVDRWNRRLVMIVADSTVALATLALALVNAAGGMQPWHIYVVLFVRSLGGSFHWPAMQASTSLMVPKEQLGRVAGMNQTLDGVSRIATPPLGALLIGLLPLYGILAIDVITAAIAIAPLTFIAIPHPPRLTTGPAASKPSLWQDLGAGLRYVWGWPALLIIMGMATTLNVLLNPAFSLLPLLVTRYLHGEALHLGWLNSVFGVGIVLGGLTLSAWGGFRNGIFTSALGILGLGMGMLLIGLAPSTAFALALTGMFASGFVMPIANGPLQAVMQRTVRPDMQGRVFTLLGSACSSATPLGLAVAGPISDAVGVPLWYVAAGVACLTMPLLMVMVPALRRLEEGAPDWTTAPTPAPEQPAVVAR